MSVGELIAAKYFSDFYVNVFIHEFGLPEV